MPPPPEPQEPTAGPRPGLVELFVGFLRIALIAFGGVLPIAHSAVVDRYKWVTDQEFVELVGLAQFLPGPNIINFCIVLGDRFRGPLGAVAAFLGLTLVPAIMVITLAVAFTHFAEVGAIANVLAGLAAAAAGLIGGMAGRMAEPMLRRPTIRGVAIGLAAFVGLIWLDLPLWMVIFGLAPLSFALSWKALP